MDKISKIVKREDGYHVVSEDGKNLGGPYGSREQAQKRLRQVEFFKHKKADSWPEPDWPQVYHEVSDTLDAVRDQLSKTEKAAYEAGRILSHLDDLLIDHRDEPDAEAKIVAATKEAIDKILAMDPRLEPIVRKLSEIIAKHSPKLQGAQARVAPIKNVLIGTSGFKYKHWSENFYPKELPGREWLRYYATRFPTVEISSTFHNMPEQRVLRTWHDSTPAGFVFAIRAPKSVTHEAHLEGCGPTMSAFMRRVEMLGDKLGPVTFQLLQSERFEAARLERFAASLPSGFRYSMEFRSEPWYNEAAYEILSKHNIATVVVGHSSMGIHTRSTADWSHIRMSGHHPDYAQNSYSDDQLKNWRGIIADSAKPAYVYFNNEYKAYAANNAIKMMEIVGLKYPETSWVL